MSGCVVNCVVKCVVKCSFLTLLGLIMASIIPYEEYCFIYSYTAHKSVHVYLVLKNRAKRNEEESL